MEFIEGLLPSRSLLIILGLNILMAFSFYIMVSAGLLSLGNSAFSAIGAYTASVLTVKFGQPLLVAIMAGAAAAALIGFLAGFPALRIRGLYLAMVTLAVEEIVQVVLRNLSYVGGNTGFQGMTGTTLWLVYVMVLFVLIILWQAGRSRLGMALQALRSDEVGASTMGISIAHMKLLAFSLGAAIAAVSGALYAHYTFFIDPASFGLTASFTPIFYVILGGIETYWGAIAGAIVLTLLTDYIEFLGNWRMVVYGVIIMVVLIVRPQGLVSKKMTTQIRSQFIRWSEKRGSIFGKASPLPPKRL